MLTIEPTGAGLGAFINGIDLSQELGDADVQAIRAALGDYGVVCFRQQSLTPVRQQAFATRFGIPQPSNEWNVPGAPMVSVLSNILVDGQNIGYVDAGMSWHKDMTYLAKPGFATMLYALEIPHRDGRSLGSTHFTNARAAYDDLPEEMKRKLEGAIGVNSAEYYNTRIIREGSVRKAFAEKKKKRAPALHPIVYTHPISGRKVLYCDPGHVERIEGFDERESGEILDFLREHQLQSKYRYAHEWSVGDLLMWDNMGTLHKATQDYGPLEHRRMHRCMVSQPDDTSSARLL